MDLNKERALFESWLMSKFSIEADSDFIYLNGDEYAHVPTQARWETWVEAKSQVPEGFVLVEKELSNMRATDLAHKEFSKISSLFYQENRYEPDSSKERLKRIWIANKIRYLKVFHKTFIESQESAHD